LIGPEDNYREITQSVDDLYQLYLSASGIDIDTDGNREHIYLDHGKAIGPSWAAMCVRETIRTKRFISGIYKAIKSARQRFTGTKLHIVYAGTGPFAALLIPMTVLFTSEEIEFTLLEINPVSIGFLKRVIDTFHIGDYVREIVRCDAARYKQVGKIPIHMIVTETMQNALQREPQVAITINLVKQMQEDGILIPQNITVDAVLLNQKCNHDRMTGTGKYEEKYYQRLDTLLKVNRNIHKTDALSDAAITDKYTFPEVEVEIPKDIDAGFSELCLFTEIQVFEDIYLNYWDCSLTLPKKILNIGSVTEGIKKVKFRYEMGNPPGFIYSSV
jgi:hypothetical protein